MSRRPKKLTPTVPATDAWPAIDRLTSDAGVDVTLCPTWYAVGKVLMDYAVTILLLPLALLLIALAALAVKSTSPGPVFYTQTRVGVKGRNYRIFKIRTMHHNCEIVSGIKWAGKNDPRVSRVGRILRATHFDELPQLFNVLLGQMSLVGPRPERPEVIQAKGLEHLVPGYKYRLLVKPGVTGLAQLQLPADSDITSVRYKVVYDLYYVQNRTLLLDLRLLFATLFKAAGGGPKAIRRIFFLPRREAVEEVFRRNLTLDCPSLTQLQPA